MSNVKLLDTSTINKISAGGNVTLHPVDAIRR